MNPGWRIRKLFLHVDPTPEAVLQHALQIHRQLPPPKRVTQVDEKTLREEVSKILEKAQTHHAAIHALKRFGHDNTRIARHLNLKSMSIFSAARIAINALQRKWHSRRPKVKQLPHYPNLQSLLQHAVEVSREITGKAIVKPRKRIVRKKPLSEFMLTIVRLAPQFITPRKQYDSRELAAAAFEKDASKITKEETNRIRHAIQRLSIMGLIPKTTRRKVTRFKKATREEIEQHTPLIHAVLNKGRFPGRDWRRYFSRGDIVKIGQEGLSYAIETFDKSRQIPFRAYAALCIGWKISNEVRRHRAKATVSIDAETRPGEARTLHDELGQPAPGEEAFQSDLELLHKLYMRRRIGRETLLIHALHGFGHTNVEIGRYFGVSRERIRQIREDAEKKLLEFQRATT